MQAPCWCCWNSVPPWKQLTITFFFMVLNTMIASKVWLFSGVDLISQIERLCEDLNLNITTYVLVSLSLVHRSLQSKCCLLAISFTATEWACDADHNHIYIPIESKQPSQIQMVEYCLTANRGWISQNFFQPNTGKTDRKVIGPIQQWRYLKDIALCFDNPVLI